MQGQSVGQAVSAARHTGLAARHTTDVNTSELRAVPVIDGDSAPIQYLRILPSTIHKYIVNEIEL